MTAWRRGHSGPGELQIQRAGRSGRAARLVTCPMPVVRRFEEVCRAAGGPFELGVVQELPQDPVLADGVVARESEQRAGLHDPRELVERVRLHETPLRMPALGPGVREQEDTRLTDAGASAVEEQTASSARIRVRERSSTGKCASSAATPLMKGSHPRKPVSGWVRARAVRCSPLPKPISSQVSAMESGNREVGRRVPGGPSRGIERAGSTCSIKAFRPGRRRPRCRLP